MYYGYRVGVCHIVCVFIAEVFLVIFCIVCNNAVFLTHIEFGVLGPVGIVGLENVLVATDTFGSDNVWNQFFKFG